ncbi:hypothetical protein A3D78_00070 [Candidatus Gottesmanbacteria bacterium RIFCSPHIGHO2_02_FULL_39_14]|uniref:Uncharacterized protein n=2 Tax=Candidatus Gottesmaniibacteriota TaxID=1752720 RepID=A0A1F6A2L4_9BACT|nr:MAG: hypothetical protein A3D78_00070 [Candidatus Gottesmanbacteria bacterium RIFCSPHIGHO2_02_FULL_39_14]OGG31987.1 MAG: hypothetical protein A3I51_02915 [Candidatus Gottesmanbacteria bacterium RIFCSPLOWO2_02_FULL_38_8]
MNNNHHQKIDPIEIHIRTYRSLLKSAGVVQIEKLIDSHKEMNSILHQKAKDPQVDTSAFIYSLLRLPSCMSMVKKIILGQSIRVFKNNRFATIESWQEVETVGRRRKMYFNGRDTLAIYIASVTDVDDLITLLTAFQIEWNNLHQVLKKSSNVVKKFEHYIEAEDVSRFKKIWGEDYHKFLTAIKYRRVNFHVQLLSGSYMEYSRATQYWWDHIEKSIPKYDLLNMPIYFVSSNTHSLVNLITRFVLNQKKELLKFLHQSYDQHLIDIWNNLREKNLHLSREFFLYYLSKKLLRTSPQLQAEKNKSEKLLGISYINAMHNLDIDAQIIPLARLPDSRVGELIDMDLKNLKSSNSLIVNIDYPLGWAAYQVLTEIGQNVGQVLGIYVMGKAAALNGHIGDILLPTTVFDAHTKNIYAINNCFNANDFKKIFKSGSVLDNQKTVTTKGTYLESTGMIEKWFREGYTDIEMEAGPYLNAVYEFIYYNRYEEDEFINLTPTPFQLGIAHYASDTPYSKAKNLGSRTLSYEGVESTYAISLTILKKIVERELKLLKEKEV